MSPKLLNYSLVNDSMAQALSTASDIFELANCVRGYIPLDFYEEEF